MGKISVESVSMESLAKVLEYSFFKQPILDQTGLTNKYDIDLKWPINGDSSAQLEQMKQTFADQLGLELAPSVEPIEMLVVERN
jgi:uncharacterized protein (TIGR03435 family)